MESNGIHSNVSKVCITMYSMQSIGIFFLGLLLWKNVDEGGSG